MFDMVFFSLLADKINHMNCLALGVSYRGNAYCGWQRQGHRADTVQETLENAISYVANENISTICAGRTDAGVHASAQVIHFATTAQRSVYGWQMGINTRLPTDIRVNWVRPVSADFHARFSAIYRRYQYVIEDNSPGNALFTGLLTPYRQALDAKAMHHAAQCLPGEHDFSSFRAAQCQSNTPFRHIDHIRVFRAQRKAPATAPADGLYLVEVGYNKDHQIPVGGKPLPFIR